ncbi:MAG: hypothetical protein HW410_1604, partial [Nitrosarchaeum sp.]|nr:hypothetical protein [Nitrosarchaeum sp.]
KLMKKKYKKDIVEEKAESQIIKEIM